jgi:hypothetical protein
MAWRQTFVLFHTEYHSTEQRQMNGKLYEISGMVLTKQVANINYIEASG